MILLPSILFVLSVLFILLYDIFKVFAILKNIFNFLSKSIDKLSGLLYYINIKMKDETIKRDGEQELVEDIKNLLNAIE